MTDPWNDGDDYEAYVGRWSRQVAPRFLDWLGLDPGLEWLDVGCGTGALTQTILDQAEPARVVAVDPSPAFVEHARTRLTDPRADVRVGDAMALPLDADSVDVGVGGLMLNFVPDPGEALSEMRRVGRAGATVAFYVWDHSRGGMQLMRHFWDAVVEHDPTQIELHEGRRFPLNVPERLAELFADAGIADVVTDEIVIPTVFRDFDDYWQPFLGTVGPAPTYVKSLDDAPREQLRELVIARLPFADDGTIPLTARAWTVRGVVPG